MSQRARIALVVVLVVVLSGAAAAYVLAARPSSTSGPSRSTTPDAVATRMPTGPRIVFRNTEIGPELGRVAVVALDDPAGPRSFTDLTCDRVFAVADRVLCLASEPGLVTTYSAVVHDQASKTQTAIPLTGSPSRARLSDDGRLAATTSFVAGDSYASTSFSTRTVVTDLSSGRSVDLEDFAILDGARSITPVDRNFWGVTFASDDDRFFVTVAYGGETHLAEGRLSTRQVRILRTDAECPSVSPDETRVAYKKRGGRPRGDWRIAVLDLATGRETELAETRSVDDQVEWLDDEHVVYGLPGEASDAAQTNVWVTSADGGGQPAILVPHAWSPAVIR
jgi:hypothetical protein